MDIVPVPVAAPEPFDIQWDQVDDEEGVEAEREDEHDGAERRAAPAGDEARDRVLRETLHEQEHEEDERRRPCCDAEERCARDQALEGGGCGAGAFEDYGLRETHRLRTWATGRRRPMRRPRGRPGCSSC